MGPCIVSIFQYTCISNKMQLYTIQINAVHAIPLYTLKMQYIFPSTTRFYKLSLSLTIFSHRNPFMHSFSPPLRTPG
jgi:hypothetical protein